MSSVGYCRRDILSSLCVFPCPHSSNADLMYTKQYMILTNAKETINSRKELINNQHD